MGCSQSKKTQIESPDKKLNFMGSPNKGKIINLI